MSMLQKSFNILATNLSVLYNYFDGPNKIILDLYFSKIVFSVIIRILMYLYNYIHIRTYIDQYT